jgi:hypothetical protein
MFEAVCKERHARCFVAALFALALALRVIVPPGFMPTQTAHGVVVSICDGMGGARSMVVDFERSDDGKRLPEHEKSSAPCTFAVHSASALAADPALAVALPILVWAALELARPICSKLPDVHFLTPPPRAPPALT